MFSPLPWGERGRKVKDRPQPTDSPLSLRQVPLMSLAKVLILYNQPVLPEDHPDAISEHEILYTTDAVANILAAAGHEVARLGLNYDPGALVPGLRQHRPDVVFN